MVRHLLLDADGVVQRVGGDGWRARVTEHLGDRTDDFVAALWELEEPALAGRGSFPDGMGPVMAGFGLDLDPEEFYSNVWLAIETLPETAALVATLRKAGLGVHLVTNQHARRATYMKQSLGYGATFDGTFYSCDLGVAKPDPAFFLRVCERLAAAPGDCLLVDDSHDNVAGAREAGLAAEHWHHDKGIDALLRVLLGHGLPLSERTAG